MPFKLNCALKRKPHPRSFPNLQDTPTSARFVHSGLAPKTRSWLVVHPMITGISEKGQLCRNATRDRATETFHMHRQQATVWASPARQKTSVKRYSNSSLPTTIGTRQYNKSRIIQCPRATDQDQSLICDHHRVAAYNFRTNTR